jgi:hypothetical protein
MGWVAGQCRPVERPPWLPTLGPGSRSRSTCREEATRARSPTNQLHGAEGQHGGTCILDKCPISARSCRGPVCEGSTLTARRGRRFLVLPRFIPYDSVWTSLQPPASSLHLQPLASSLQVLAPSEIQPRIPLLEPALPFSTYTTLYKKGSFVLEWAATTNSAQFAKDSSSS